LKIPFGELKKYKVWSEDFQPFFNIFFFICLAADNAYVLSLLSSVL
jgi:hypothetical protein